MSSGALNRNSGPDLRLSGQRRILHAYGRFPERLARREKDNLETMLCFKRAGADGVLTYFAPQVARWLNEEGRK